MVTIYGILTSAFPSSVCRDLSRLIKTFESHRHAISSWFFVDCLVGLFGFLMTIYLLFGCSLPAKWALQAVCSEFLSIVWLDLAWCWVGCVRCPPMTLLKDRIDWRQWPLQKKQPKKHTLLWSKILPLHMHIETFIFGCSPGSWHGFYS